MSAPYSSNAQEEENEQAIPPVSANNADHNRKRCVNPNSGHTSAAHTDSDQHYCKKLRSRACNRSTPAISNIVDAVTTSSMPHEVMSRSGTSGASRHRSTIVSSEQSNRYMANPALDSSPPKRKSYSCPQCHNVFRSGQSLGGHMNSHRNANANPRQEIDQAAGGQSGPSRVENSPIYRGVRHRKEQNKWVVEIRPPKEKRTVWLGTYESSMEAAYANDAAVCYFGTGSPLNFKWREIYRNIQKVPAGLPEKQRTIEIRKVIKEISRQAMEEDRIPTGEAASQMFNAGGDEPELPEHHRVDASIATTSHPTPDPVYGPIAAPTSSNVQEEHHHHHEANVAEDNLDDHLHKIFDEFPELDLDSLS